MTPAERMGETIIDGKKRYYKRGMTQAEYTPFAHQFMDSQRSATVNGGFLTDYMNREDVRKAFNIPTEAQTWEECSSTLDYHVQDEASMWIYPILKDKARLMFYSGDTDGAITTYGSKMWMKSLGWPVVDAWRPWYNNGQVAGYTESYDGLQFVTVKGVGHMAPQWAREKVTNMISAFIHNEDF